jgi:hypothetical protein
MKTAYQTIWNNAHACGALGTFATAEEAEAAGENWQADILADDPAGADEYYYEVTEVEEYTDDEKLDAEYAAEASYEHFNRYVAGDR